jgi:hypothetical protein
MNIALRVPKSIGHKLKEFSDKESISMNQFIVTAIAEKMSSLETYDYLEERAQKGSVEKLKKILSKVPDAELVNGDELA